MLRLPSSPSFRKAGSLAATDLIKATCPSPGWRRIASRRPAMDQARNSSWSHHHPLAMVPLAPYWACDKWRAWGFSKCNCPPEAEPGFMSPFLHSRSHVFFNQEDTDPGGQPGWAFQSPPPAAGPWSRHFTSQASVSSYIKWCWWQHLPQRAGITGEVIP